MASKKFLEDIVSEEKEKVTPVINFSERFNQIIETLSKHPIITSIFYYEMMITSSQYVDLIIRKSRVLDTPFLGTNIEETRALAFLSAGYTYMLLGAIRQYNFERTGIGLKKGKSLVDKLYNWVLDNPKIIGSCTGLLSMAPILLTKNSTAVPDAEEGIQTYFLYITTATMLATNFAINGIKNIRKIKNNISKNKIPIKEKLYNFIFEHPLLISGSIFTYNIINEIQNKYTKLTIVDNDKMFSFGDSRLKWLGTSIGGYLTLTALGAFGITFAGSFLHTSSLRKFKAKLLGIYYEIVGKTKEAIKNQRDIVEKSNTLESRIEETIKLGNLHYKKNEKDEAYKNYALVLRLFDRKEDSLSYFEFFKKSFNIDKISRFLKSRINSGIESAFIALLNKEESALEKIKDVVEKDPEDYKTRYLYGRALEILDLKESGRKQKTKAVEQALKVCEVDYKSGSKRTINLFKDNLLGTEVIGKLDKSKKSLENELEITLRLREKLKEHSHETVKPISIINVNENYFYAMERAEGETLSEKIKNNSATIDHFSKIAECLAIAHATIPLEELSGERDYIGLVEKRLKEIHIDERLIENITSSLPVVISSFDKLEKVYNKDAKPDNWIILPDSTIVMCDIEKGNSVTLPYDCATLFSFHNTLTEDERDRVIERHVEFYGDLRKRKINMKNYKIAYFDALVLRAFEAYTRPFIEKESKMYALTNAKKSIERIKEEFIMHYLTDDNYLKYGKLKSSIESLACILSN